MSEADLLSPLAWAGEGGQGEALRTLDRYSPQSDSWHAAWEIPHKVSFCPPPAPTHVGFVPGHCRGNIAHEIQSGSDSGPGFKEQVLKTL